MDGDPSVSPGENIVVNFIKPNTQQNEKSYVECLFNDLLTQHLIGDCTMYVSHPWSIDFSETLAALGEYERSLPHDAPKQFYFCDYVSINQHNAEDDLRKIADVIRTCQTLVLMGKPWQTPVTVDRLWCIYEICQAVLGKTEVVVILPPKQWDEFHEALVKCMADVWSFLRDVFQGIDSCNAGTSVPADAEMIKKFIRKHLGGFKQVDQIVAEGLQTWLKRYILAMVEEFPDNGTMKHASFAYDAGDFFFDLELFQNSYHSYEHAAKLYKSLGHKFNWLTARNGMMIAMSNMGKKRESLNLSIELVNECVQEFGPNNEKTLDMKDNLATEYQERGMLEKAEPILREVLEGYQKIQPPMSKDIRITMMTLSRTLMQTNKVDEATKILDEMIAYETKRFGRNDESTLCSVSLYGRCQALKGMHFTAVALYQEALPVMLDKWGSDDTHVMNCKEWLEESKAALKKGLLEFKG